jgi:prevent-host-death family protein
MSKSWQLQEAKNKFSQVVDEAQSKGPQTITRRGKEVAVVLSASEYYELTASKIKLSDFFSQSPLSELSLERDKSPLRE